MFSGAHILPTVTENLVPADEGLLANKIHRGGPASCGGNNAFSIFLDTQLEGCYSPRIPGADAQNAYVAPADAGSPPPNPSASSSTSTSSPTSSPTPTSASVFYTTTVYTTTSVVTTQTTSVTVTTVSSVPTTGQQIPSLWWKWLTF